MKRLLFIPFLLICVSAYAAPDSTLSVTPAAVSGNTITAADENSRNNAITTWANNHDHTDVSTTGNTLKVGDATAGNKTIQANNADANKPSIYFDDTNNRWILTQEGTDARTIVVVTGATTSHYIIPQSPSDEDILVYDADVNAGELKATKSLTNISSAGFTATGTVTLDSTTTSFASATISDLGTVTTANIDNGTMDGVTIAGATTTGTVFYNDGSDDVAALVPGADGHVLTSTGTSGIPAYEALGFTLISTTTSASSTNTGNIAIEASKVYLVTMDIDNATAAATTVLLRFNSSSTSSGYAWSGESYSFNTTSVVDTDGDDSDSDIDIATDHTNGYADSMVSNASNGFVKGHFYIDTNKVSTAYSAFVTGEFVVNGNGGALEFATFGGLNQENLTITDFELVFGNNAAYTIKLYELK
jgi:hypothetical protein